jgi:transposase
MGKHSITLSQQQRHELEKLISAGTAPARSIMHAHILLKADASSQGPRWSDQQIEDAFAVSYRTILRTRKRFVSEGVQAALHRKKQGTRPEKRVLDGVQEAYILAVLCHEKPEGRERWTLRMLAQRAVELEIVEQVSHETIRDLLKKTT